MEMPTTSLIDARDAAKYLQLKLKNLQRRTRGGEIPAIRIGRFWRYRLKDLDDWISAQVTFRCHPRRE